MYPVFPNSVDPDQLVSEASDLDLHCLSLSMWIWINNLDQVKLISWKLLLEVGMASLFSMARAKS